MRHRSTGSCMLTVALTLFSFYDSRPQTPIVAIRVIAAGQPAFAGLLRLDFPTVANDPQLSDFSHLIVLVNNPNPFPIRAFSIRWDIKRPTTKPDVQFAKVVGESRQSNPAYAEAVVLRPNETQLISPFFRFSAVGWKSSETSSPSPLRLFLSNTPISESNSLGATTTVKLDCVIDESWRVYGSDTAGLQHLIRSRRTAEKDEAQRIFAATRSDSSFESIRSILTSERATDTSGQTKSQAAYAGERKFLAQRLLLLYQTGDTDTFNRTVATLMNMPDLVMVQIPEPTVVPQSH